MPGRFRPETGLVRSSDERCNAVWLLGNDAQSVAHAIACDALMMNASE